MTRPRIVVVLVAAALFVVAIAGVAVLRQDRRSLAVFLGDSYTVGTWANGATPFTALVAKEFEWREVNLGRGGTGYIGGVRSGSAQRACGREVCLSYTQMLPDAVALNPDIVVISGGRNEVSTYPAAWESGVDGFFTAIREALPDATVIVTSPIWDDDPAPERLHVMGDVIRQAVAEIGGVYLDLGAPLLGRPDLLGADGVHPNWEGHAAIAAAFSEALRAAG